MMCEMPSNVIFRIFEGNLGLIQRGTEAVKHKAEDQQRGAFGLSISGLNNRVSDSDIRISCFGQGM